MQLDIFDNSRDVMLRNDVVAALERRDTSAAGIASRALAAEYPGDALQSSFEVLIGALEASSAVPFADRSALQRARRALDEDIEPAARQALGNGASAWLMPLRRELAQRADAIGFDPARADEHAAPLWLSAGDARAAADATERIASWRRIPAPLGWMAEARHRLEGLDAAWPLLAELAWLAPARLDALLPNLADPVLARLRKHFDAGFEGEGNIGDLAWLPAWVLTDEPRLAPLLARAQPSRHTEPEQAMRLLVELIGLERQGRRHDIVDRRRRLRDLNGSVYDAYMRNR